MENMQNILPLLFALLAVGAVLYLSYLFSRYLARGTAKLTKSKHIKIVDRVALGQDKMLLVVKVGEKNYLIGSSSQSIRVLTEIDELPEESAQADSLMGSGSFQAALQMMLAKKEKRRDDN